MGWYVLRVHIWYILSGKDWAGNRLRHARGHDTNCEMLCLDGCEDADSCKYKDADSCKYKEADSSEYKKADSSKYKHKHVLMQIQAHKIQYGLITIWSNPTKSHLRGSQSLSGLNEVENCTVSKWPQTQFECTICPQNFSPAIQKCISQSSIIEAIFIVSAPLLSPCLQEGFCRYKFAQRRWFASLTNKVHILWQGAHSLE